MQARSCIYAYQHFTKTDINECLRKVHNCSQAHNEECQNTNGSFTCICKEGFRRANTIQQCLGKCLLLYCISFIMTCIYIQILMNVQKITIPALYLRMKYVSITMEALLVNVLMATAGIQPADYVMVIVTIDHNVSSISD